MSNIYTTFILITLIVFIFATTIVITVKYRSYIKAYGRLDKKYALREEQIKNDYSLALNQFKSTYAAFITDADAARDSFERRILEIKKEHKSDLRNTEKYISELQSKIREFEKNREEFDKAKEFYNTFAEKYNLLLKLNTTIKEQNIKLQIDNDLLRLTHD